eukprot:3543439-Pleurochrysis_carterae.AAC.1
MPTQLRAPSAEHQSRRTACSAPRLAPSAERQSRRIMPPHLRASTAKHRNAEPSRRTAALPLTSTEAAE